MFECTSIAGMLEANAGFWRDIMVMIDTQSGHTMDLEKIVESGLHYDFPTIFWETHVMENQSPRPLLVRYTAIWARISTA